jgi:hypothetical protein
VDLAIAERIKRAVGSIVYEFFRTCLTEEPQYGALGVDFPELMEREASNDVRSILTDWCVLLVDSTGVHGLSGRKARR